MSALSARRRCLGPLALTLGLVVAVVVLSTQPWRSQLRTYQEAATAAAAQVARFETRLARRPLIEQALVDLQNRTQGQRSYIQGQTLGLGGANLQQLTKGLVEAAGGSLVSSQITTPPSEPPLQLLVNKVRMRGDTEALLKLAHRVETGEPTLFLDNLVVRGARSRGRRRVVGTLDIQFDLVGYMLLAPDADKAP